MKFSLEGINLFHAKDKLRLSVILPLFPFHFSQKVELVTRLLILVNNITYAISMHIHKWCRSEKFYLVKKKEFFFFLSKLENENEILGVSEKTGTILEQGPKQIDH